MKVGQRWKQVLLRMPAMLHMNEAMNYQPPDAGERSAHSIF
jgi:hypothetical protein